MILNEQQNGYVALDGSQLRLVTLDAFVNSSQVYWIKPEFPASAVYIKIGNESGDDWNATVKCHFHPRRGLWRAYVPGINFTGRCETTYRIVSVDEYGGRHVSGEGMLRVYSGKIQDLNDRLEECYTVFPDGKWRKVTVTYDSVGAAIFTVSTETYEINHTPEPLYAFDKTTGMFHEVRGVFDLGEPSLEVLQTPVEEGGTEIFVHDTVLGFYRRIEATQDSTETETLVTGEQVI